jgi:hypothetical protein
MTMMLSRPWSRFSLILLGLAIPVAMVMSCASGNGDLITSGANGTPTGTASPTSTGTNVFGGLCGDAACPITPGTEQCDGGGTISILSKVKPPTRLSAAPDGILSAAGVVDPCKKVVDWGTPDAGVPDVWQPPLQETFTCPVGTIRVHVRDIWSKLANPTLGTLTARPLAVSLIEPTMWGVTTARAESKSCDWYSVCAPQPYLSQFYLGVVGPDGCAGKNNLSGKFDISSFSSVGDVWIDYQGTSSTLTADYNTARVGADGFRVTADRNAVASVLCPAGAPDDSVPDGYTKVHIRWFWGDPSKTGFSGTACELQKMGFSTPPYPTTLKLQGGACEMQAMLELQNGNCPWYYVLIPNSAWVEGQPLDVWYMNSTDQSKNVYATGPKLPKREQDEYWLAYAGPPDNVSWAGQGTVCLNYSNRPDSYRFYQRNPGPGYQGCGGGDVAIDPCNPPVPSGYHTVHFRYLWAGQKIFTFFPSLDLMPSWIILEVKNNGANGGSENVTCTREADRPWFNCQVPDKYFVAGSTWRAVDKTVTDGSEWNTVQERPFPDTVGEYWIRWYYGKPDYNGTFKNFDYYPDGVGGDWAATGDWNDEACANKPTATPIDVGFGGWFPYDETGYGYPNGVTLAATYPEPKKVQQLFNYLVQERYLIWKQNYLRYGADACGDGTARVKTDPPETVSEGQAYGIAISAAIGDKATFDQLWKFVRHYLSQSSKKYCGGLMGWMWESSARCRPLDSPCDPDSENCGGQGDSAFDGDVDIGIGLVFAALQWPEYRPAAISWLLKMECELNPVYDPNWVFGSKGDTADKNCANYEKGNPNSKPCTYTAGSNGETFINYYPPGYFRVFGDFLEKYLDPATNNPDQRKTHRDLWYKAAASVYEQLERCYDQAGVHPALTSDNGTWAAPCSSSVDNYNWARYLWRVGIDAAWFGNRKDLPENQPSSSRHYPPKSQIQAKIDLIQDFFNNFYRNNPVEPNANRFSSICDRLQASGTITACDPGFGHNSYFIGTMASAYVSVFDNGQKTTSGIRREAIEEAISTTIMNDKYYQESLGVYTLMFLTGNFPNPLVVE